MALALGDGDFNRPGPFPRGGIIDGELVDEGVGVESSETFRKFHILAASPERTLVGKIGCLHNQCFAFPTPARISFPLSNILRKVCTTVSRNDANLMAHFNQ